MTSGDHVLAVRHNRTNHTRDFTSHPLEEAMRRASLERDDAQLLRHQFTSKAGSVLDDDDAHAVVLDAVEQLGKAPPRLDGVGTGSAGQWTNGVG